MEIERSNAGDWVGCRVCGQIHQRTAVPPGWIGECCRCHATIEQLTAASLPLTTAFALTALFLYWPANAFPILRMNLYGATSENTVWQGCVRLYQEGDPVIAAVVFLASIAIPLLKLVAILFLVLTSWFGMTRWPRGRTRLYNFLETIGRWSMLDVFVLAVLVSLVKLKRLATVVPGSGMLAFTGVVVFTVLASACFDPELIWSHRKGKP